LNDGLEKRLAFIGRVTCYQCVLGFILIVRQLVGTQVRAGKQARLVTGQFQRQQLNHRGMVRLLRLHLPNHEHGNEQRQQAGNHQSEVLNHGSNDGIAMALLSNLATILFQLFMLTTLLLDGFESAAQVLCGEAKGSKDRSAFVSLAKLNLFWGLLVGAALSCAYWWIGADFAATFSTDATVSSVARDYTFWVILLPVVGVCSFVLDGICVGAGWTRGMLVTMIGGITFFVGMLLLSSPLTNTWLWLAWTLFFVVRAGGMFLLMPRLVRRDFSDA